MRSEDLPSLQAELDQAWGELQALEDSREPASAESAPDGATRTMGGRCERISELAKQICGLSDRMCALAREHPGEPRYQEACEQGEESCTLAIEAAATCAVS